MARRLGGDVGDGTADAVPVPDRVDLRGDGEEVVSEMGRSLLGERVVHRRQERLERPMGDGGG